MVYGLGILVPLGIVEIFEAGEDVVGGCAEFKKDAGVVEYCFSVYPRGITGATCSDERCAEGGEGGTFKE